MLQTPILTPGAKGVGFYWSRASVSSFKLGLPEVRVYVSSSHGQFLKDRGCDTNSPKRFPGRGVLAGGRGTTDGPHPHSFRPRTRPPPNLPAKGEPAGARGFCGPHTSPLTSFAPNPVHGQLRPQHMLERERPGPALPPGQSLALRGPYLGFVQTLLVAWGPWGRAESEQARACQASVH